MAKVELRRESSWIGSWGVRLKTTISAAYGEPRYKLLPSGGVLSQSLVPSNPVLRIGGCGKAGRRLSKRADSGDFDAKSVLCLLDHSVGCAFHAVQYGASRGVIHRPKLFKPDHWPTDADQRGDMLHRATADRCQHDARPFHMLALPATIGRDRLKPLSVRCAQDHTYCLDHAHRIARPRHVVNPQNASEH